MHISSILFSSSQHVNRLTRFIRLHHPVHRQQRDSHTNTAAAERKHSVRVKVANFDILGTWDSRTELPLELESSINLGKPIPKILISAIGSHSVKGRYCQCSLQQMIFDRLFAIFFIGGLTMKTALWLRSSSQTYSTLPSLMVMVVRNALITASGTWKITSCTGLTEERKIFSMP